jgi:acyl-CoA dehydrogenase
LFDRHTYGPPRFERPSTDSSTAAKERVWRNYHSCGWYAEFLQFAAPGAIVPGMARRRGQRRPRQAVGHRPGLGVRRAPAFDGLDYWYAWPVTILGLGPIWQNEGD